MFHETYILFYIPGAPFILLSLPSPVTPPPLRDETKTYVQYVENQGRILHQQRAGQGFWSIKKEVPNEGRECLQRQRQRRHEERKKKKRGRLASPHLQPPASDPPPQDQDPLSPQPPVPTARLRAAPCVRACVRGLGLPRE